MSDWEIKRATRDGAFRMYWRDGSYSDFPSRDEALHFAGDPLAPSERAQRLENETSVVLEGDALATAVRTRRVAASVYEAIRLDQRRLELELSLERLAWEGDDAIYSFSGAGQRYLNKLTREALLTHPAAA